MPNRQVNHQARHNQDWKAWPEVTIGITRLPFSVSTQELYEAFEAFGQIVYIEILEDIQGSRNGSARLRFSPAPNKPFWTAGTQRFTVGGLKLDLAFRLEKPSGRNVIGGTIQSPVRGRKRYNIKTLLDPTLMQFGTLVGENSMMEMMVLNQIQLEEGNQSLGLEIDLLRKRMEVIFTVLHEIPGGMAPRVYKFFVHFTQMREFFARHLTETGGLLRYTSRLLPVTVG